MRLDFLTPGTRVRALFLVRRDDARRAARDRSRRAAVTRLRGRQSGTQATARSLARFDDRQAAAERERVSPRRFIEAVRLGMVR